MQLGDTVEPHSGLQVVGRQTRLRPLGRRPVLLQRYCCRVCKANWLLERDPLQPEHWKWVCLYRASSILDPVSAMRQGTRLSHAPSTTVQLDAVRGETPGQIRHSLT